MNLMSDGWMPVLYPWEGPTDYPQNHKLIQIFREGWDSPQTLNWYDINPAMNVNGLYWRPVRIIDAPATQSPNAETDYEVKSTG